MTAVVVSMPFMQIDRPSIQIGLLKAIGTAQGFDVRTLHANLDLAALIGVDHYRRLAEHRGRMLGEWLFSPEAFGDAAPDREALLLKEFADELDFDRECLLHIRDHQVPAFLDALIDGYPWEDMRLVAFSSTFQQNTASFALARRLKQRQPDTPTVFGGANFDGEMGLELVRSVDCIDYAVIGEGDTAFPQLLSALAEGREPDGIAGLATRTSTTPPAPPREQLDDLPAPDYSEYFERAATLGIPTNDVWLPFESARGCWWGAKHHCTFCGLNGTTMSFRSKSPQRVMDELALQTHRHQSFRFEAVDNILDPKYLTELFPRLTNNNYEIFYEVKANLTRAQLKVLAEAGVTSLQPGIESLSSHVLRLMNKGVRAAQNVNLLRWARYYGISIGWNILWGFPGETENHYAEQVAIVPHLTHLQPPATVGRVWLERFSPLFTRISNKFPEPSYRYVYPASIDLDRVAYFFEYDTEKSTAAHSAMVDAVAGWSGAWRNGLPTLTFRYSPGYLEIEDRRDQGRDGTYRFHDTLADIYFACSERPTTTAAVRRKLGLDLPAVAVEDAFAQFRERGLMFLDDNLRLALAIPATAGR